MSEHVAEAPLTEREALLVNKWVGRLVALGLGWVATRLPAFHGFAELVAGAVTVAAVETATDFLARAKVYSKARVDAIRRRLES